MGVSFALYHGFTTSPARHISISQKTVTPALKKTQTKPKPSPWQREWLRSIYWSIKAETNTQQLGEQGRAYLIAGFMREKSGRRIWLQSSTVATVSEWQSSPAPPEEKEGEENYRPGCQFTLISQCSRALQVIKYSTYYFISSLAPQVAHFLVLKRFGTNPIILHTSYSHSLNHCGRQGVSKAMSLQTGI